MVAAVGVAIAYGQWRTAQNKLKLDLFEKRMSVYQTARDMISFVATRGKINPEEQLKYLLGIQTAKWLFGLEVAEYLQKTLWKQVVGLDFSQTMMSNTDRDDPERSKYITNKAETLAWVIDQYKVLDAK